MTVSNSRMWGINRERVIKGMRGAEMTEMREKRRKEKEKRKKEKEERKKNEGIGNPFQ